MKPNDLINVLTRDLYNAIKASVVSRSADHWHAYILSKCEEESIPSLTPTERRLITKQVIYKLEEDMIDKETINK